MPAPINTINISGKIVNDIEIRKTKNKNISVCNFRLMHNAPTLRHPVYVDVEVWGKEAERIKEQAARESLVVVYGELRRDVWSSEEGDPRSKLKITAKNIVIDNSIKGSSDRSGGVNQGPHVSFD